MKFSPEDRTGAYDFRRSENAPLSCAASPPPTVPNQANPSGCACIIEAARTRRAMEAISFMVRAGMDKRSAGGAGPHEDRRRWGTGGRIPRKVTMREGRTGQSDI